MAKIQPFFLLCVLVLLISAACSILKGAITAEAVAMESLPKFIAPTTQWDSAHQGGPKLDWRRYEYGLRSDGVIVWREKSKR